MRASAGAFSFPAGCAAAPAAWIVLTVPYREPFDQRPGALRLLTPDS
ncbi:MAG TPA: hypothetical protein VF897_19570 [Roseiflexaceae bacterium]